MAGGLGSLVVELSANIGRFEAAMNRAQYIANRNSREIASSVKGMQASFDAIPGAIARIATSAIALGGIGLIFKKAIEAADEFKVSTISIAAGLTNIAKPGQGDFGSLFQRNLAFAKDMAKKLEEVAAKQFATPKEMMTAYNQLVQQGYAARLDEAEALGLVVDRIKLATAGQDSERQLNQEIRSLMQGQAVAGSMIANELQTRLGPAWVDIVNQHKQAGDLLKFLADLWPGMAAATSEVEHTLEAQGSTLEGHLKYLGRTGLAGLYDDIVGTVKSINEFLKQHEETIAGGILRGWVAVKDMANGVLGVIGLIYEQLRQITSVTWRLYIQPVVSGLGAAAKFLAGGADVAGGFGMETPGAARTEGVGQFIGPPLPPKKPMGGPPEVSVPKIPTAGGGKGGKGGADDIQKEIDKINKEVEKARKAAMDAENDAWNMIWNLKKSNAEMYLEAEKNQYDSLSLAASLYSSLATLSPILGEQNVYKQKALDLEIEIDKYTLQRKLDQLGVNKAQADELMGLKALEAQMKKYNAEMERNKGLSGWAFRRTKSVNEGNYIEGMMTGLESGFQNAFSSGLQGVLSKDKNTLKDIGKTMFQGLIGEIHKGSIKRLFDSFAKMVGPGTSPLGGGREVGTDLNKAAQGLQQASIGFDTNSAQFGLAAGGLLLSGVGIMTNSQALVVAGTVLQMAGIAIQTYQALTATTAMTEFTIAATALSGSAVALSGAATMLMAAAATDFIPFFHSGGLIKAHRGWPLASDEVPIIAQTGERVLSRRQNRDYEAGLQTGGGMGNPVIFSPTVNIHPKQEMTQADYNRHAKMIVKAWQREMGNKFNG